MNNYKATAVLIVLSAISGCDDKKPSGSSAAPTSASAGGGTTKPSCADGEWGEPSGAFCIKLPAGFKYKETKPNGAEKRVEFENPPGGVYLNAYFRNTGKIDYEAGLGNIKTDADQAAKEQKGSGFEAQGDAPKGTGKYFVYVDVNKWHRCMVKLLKGETVVSLEIFGKKLAPEHIDACKTAYAP